MEKPNLASGLAKIGLFVAGVALAAAFALEGRIVDSHRNPLPGVRVTWSPWNFTGITDAEGRYRIGFPSPVVRTLHTPSAPEPNEAVRADGRRAGSDYPGTPLFHLLPDVRLQRAPLAKTAPHTVLVAEKSGYATSRIQVPADASTLPEIILPSGPGPSLLQGQTSVKPIFSAPMAKFESGTSTDLPNVYSDSDKVNPSGKPGRIQFAPYDSLRPTESSIRLHNPASTSMYVAVVWSLTTVPGATATILPHASVPDSLGKAGAGRAFQADDEGNFLDFIQEYYHFVPSGARSLGPVHYGDSVTLLLRGPGTGSDYATMKWLQFTGPVRSAMEHIIFGGGYWTKIYALHTGAVPSLDTCGRLSGRIEWKGAAPKPELWIGMAGTDLFTRVDADGGFLTADLPPGVLPLVVVAIGPDAHGITRRTFYNLQGLAVSPGQTTLLDPLEIPAP
jgi:hypothetical protein